MEAATERSIPAAGETPVVWAVGATSPDYVYVFGGGSSSGDHFTVELDAAPPADALNEGLGVAVLLLVPEGTSPLEGPLSSQELEGAVLPSALGASGTYSIIYKAPGWAKPVDWEGLGWVADFREGFSCGRGVPARPGEAFDGFEPVDCADVTIRVDDLENIEFTNWT